MKVTGGTTLRAPAEAVWMALRDGDLLARTIPGCRRLDVVGPGRIHLDVTTALPAIAGTYAGDAVISEQAEPAYLRATLSGAGGPGTVDATIEVRLRPAREESTELSYDVDAEFGGAIAAIGQRMLASIARRLAEEFLGTLTEILAEPPGLLPAEATRDDILGVDESAEGETAEKAGWSGFKSGLIVSAAAGLSGIVIAAVLRRARRGPGRLP